MEEAIQIKSVALFFYFALMDEERAKDASFDTYYQIKRSFSKTPHTPDEIIRSIVRMTKHKWDKFTEQERAASGQISFDGDWVIGKDLELGQWREFKKSAEEEEFLAVIWSQVLKFSDKEIANGLDVTVGTVRHRVGRGLRLMAKLRH